MVGLMAPTDSPSSHGRQERRKAATRAKIQAAAEVLFSEQGYSETSIEDISEAADVAVRTIYTHFPSKASIMLAYFDSWVDAFIGEVLQRPVEEPVIDTVRAALSAMNDAGWVDRVENDDVRVHPLVEHLGSGAPDIAGHILQRWMREMQNIAADTAARGSHPQGSLESTARGVAVFSAWIAAMSAARSRLESETPGMLPPHATGSSLGLDVFALITSGKA